MKLSCSFPQNARTLYALESSIFIRFLFRLLRSSDLDLLTTLAKIWEQKVSQKVRIIFLLFGYNLG